MRECRAWGMRFCQNGKGSRSYLLIYGRPLGLSPKLFTYLRP